MPTPKALRGLAAALLLACTPTSARACVIDPADAFAPWPPCKADAGKLATRLDGRNAQILGDVMLTINMVNDIKREVRLWRETTDEVVGMEQRLRRVYGDMLVSPIASMAMAYQSTALGSYVRIRPNGQIGFTEQITDAVADGRARMQGFVSGSVAQRALGGVRYAGEKDLSNAAIQQLGLADRQLRATVDYRQRVNFLTDSVFAAANRRASRYVGEKDPEGYVEGVLSSAEAALSKARVTALATQTRSIPGRTRMLEFLGSAEEAAKRAQTRLGTSGVGH